MVPLGRVAHAGPCRLWQYCRGLVAEGLLPLLHPLARSVYQLPARGNHRLQFLHRGVGPVKKIVEPFPKRWLGRLLRNLLGNLRGRVRGVDKNIAQARLKC